MGILFLGCECKSLNNSEEQLFNKNTELCKIVKSYGGFYATHTRKRGESNSVEAVEEAIRTAQKSGVSLQVSHLLPRSGVEECERCIQVVDDARKLGLNVHFDMHTRPFGLAYLHFALPSWLNPTPESNSDEFI